MSYMDVKMAISHFGTGFPANTLAENRGEHLVNIKLATDTANGMLVAADVSKAWPEFDVFDEKAVTEFEGIVEQQMVDGSWLVLVTKPGDALFVYNRPLTPYESPKELLKEEAMYNKAGKVVRTYKLAAFDRIAVSADNFNGTPVAGTKIISVTNKKMDLI